MAKRVSVQSIMALVTILLTAAVLLPLFLSSHPWPERTTKLLSEVAIEQTGAINLVSAIYLGYRAFDTLGETIVLLVAVSGTISILSNAGVRLPAGYTNTQVSHTATFRKQRTHLLETVTGIMAPIVLVFGCYVMLYGHLSPGGGFQGGVVIASGIVFLAVGNRKEAKGTITSPNVLRRIESVTFLLLIIAASLGLFLGVGFFSSFFPQSLPTELYIILLNSIIGLKVGAGIGLLCIAMLSESEDD